ncbi:hypothetical protein LC613_24120 [Nostoc sphaeroides CHAB 2801]|uniref:Uncharacterized protein n=1 Tax=Nostoc sphaeroides CCNUC1 TaxID=2653204 RepID=A0A5P8W3X3_9NOSO|nr:hypothetical protein [Nostoc sphaeroides]MCC5630912.1 hypothetical protein [Nostoc sphaeroides CHAB 2801]QFS46986.1 hypothetical protein GXM_04467 [Nostoc sphaeroides CCNUC1]
MPIVGAAASQTRGSSPIEVHFQQEAGNEVLKEFLLKLTPMGSAVPLRVYLT